MKTQNITFNIFKNGVPKNSQKTPQIASLRPFLMTQCRKNVFFSVGYKSFYKKMDLDDDGLNPKGNIFTFKSTVKNQKYT